MTTLAPDYSVTDGVIYTEIGDVCINLTVGDRLLVPAPFIGIDWDEQQYEWSPIVRLEFRQTDVVIEFDNGLVDEYWLTSEQTVMRPLCANCSHRADKLISHTGDMYNVCSCCLPEITNVLDNLTTDDNRRDLVDLDLL